MWNSSPRLGPKPEYLKMWTTTKLKKVTMTKLKKLDSDDSTTLLLDISIYNN